MKFIHVHDVDSGTILAINTTYVKTIERVGGRRFDVFLTGKTYLSVVLGKNSEILFTNLDEVLEYINK